MIGNLRAEGWLVDVAVSARDQIFGLAGGSNSFSDIFSASRCDIVVSGAVGDIVDDTSGTDGLWLSFGPSNGIPGDNSGESETDGTDAHIQSWTQLDIKGLKDLQTITVIILATTSGSLYTTNPNVE